MQTPWLRTVGKYVSFFIIIVCSLILSSKTSEAGKPGTDSGGTVMDLQSWSEVLPAAQRFVLLSAVNNQAVLDRETGLVWEQSPATTTDKWLGARGACANKNVGNCKGWRLPSPPELSSLIDPLLSPPGPLLPVGHPFGNIQCAV